MPFSNADLMVMLPFRQAMHEVSGDTKAARICVRADEAVWEIKGTRKGWKRLRVLQRSPYRRSGRA